MEFRLSPEQRGFAASLTDLMVAADSVKVARAWASGDTAPGLALWTRLAEQGVQAIVVPEEHDGMGGSEVDLVVAFEVLGHQLAVGPWIESAAYGAVLLSSATGISTFAVTPHVPLALDADIAEAVYLVDEEGVRTGTCAGLHRSVDTTRRLFDLEPGRVVEAVDRAEEAFDLAALAASAELLGAGERLLADSVGYVQRRSQYGRTIGSFQAIKHQLADVRIALDFARPLVHGAALSVGTPDASRDVSAAKVGAADAAYLASRVALQVHGAIGYTAELDLGLWINRVRALVGAWGTPSFHRARVADSFAGAL